MLHDIDDKTILFMFKGMLLFTFKLLYIRYGELNYDKRNLTEIETSADLVDMHSQLFNFQK